MNININIYMDISCSFILSGPVSPLIIGTISKKHLLWLQKTKLCEGDRDSLFSSLSCSGLFLKYKLCFQILVLLIFLVLFHCQCHCFSFRKLRSSRFLVSSMSLIYSWMYEHATYMDLPLCLVFSLKSSVYLHLLLCCFMFSYLANG